VSIHESNFRTDNDKGIERNIALKRGACLANEWQSHCQCRQFAHQGQRGIEMEVSIKKRVWLGNRAALAGPPALKIPTLSRDLDGRTNKLSAHTHSTPSHHDLGGANKQRN